MKRPTFSESKAIIWVWSHWITDALEACIFFKNDKAAKKISEGTTKILPSPKPFPSTSEDFFFSFTPISLKQKPEVVNLMKFSKWQSEKCKWAGESEI